MLLSRQLFSRRQTPMHILFVFVPLIFSVLMIGALAKLAVFVSRTGTLSWKHSFFFAGFLFTLAMTVRVFLNFFPMPDVLPPLLRAVCGVALTTAFAVFFFGHHAVTADRAAIGRAGALKAAAVWAGFCLLFSLPILLLAPRP
jgi:hypothetical protein